jgi:hypothetical protein
MIVIMTGDQSIGAFLTFSFRRILSPFHLKDNTTYKNEGLGDSDIPLRVEALDAQDDDCCRVRPLPAHALPFHATIDDERHCALN